MVFYLVFFKLSCVVIRLPHCPFWLMLFTSENKKTLELYVFKGQKRSRCSEWHFTHVQSSGWTGVLFAFLQTMDFIFSFHA